MSSHAEAANSFNLSQLVKETTCVSCSCSSSLIDLVFVPSNLTSNSCHILPPVSTSDHNSIFFQFVEVFLPTLIFLVLVVDGCMIKLTLTLLTSSFLPYLGTLYSLISNVNYNWSIFKEIFLNIMNRTISTKVSYPTTHPPWINKAFLSMVKKRKQLFARAKRNVSTSLWFA